MGEEAIGGVIDEKDEFLAGDALGVGGPSAPLKFLGNDGCVTIADEFEFLVLLVKDFQKKHPAELLETLSIAGNPAILPHDVTDVFDDRSDVGHEILRSGDFVKVGGEFLDGLFVGGLATEGTDDLERGAEAFNGVKGDDGSVLEVERAVVGIFIQQAVEDGAGEVAILRKVIALAHVLGAFPAGQRLLLKGNVANQVEGIEGGADFIPQGGEDDTVALQFFDDGALLVGVPP